MRTTLNLDDQLVISAKHRALEEKVPLSQVISDRWLSLGGSAKKGDRHRKTIRVSAQVGPVKDSDGLIPGSRTRS